MPLKGKLAIFERFNIQSLYNTFLGLTPRDQIIAMVAAGVVLILIVILPISLASGKLSKLESQISQGKEQVNDVVREIDDFNGLKNRLASVEGSLKAGFDTSTSTTLENLATQSGIKENVDSLKERPVVPAEIFDEAGVDVRISRVTLQQLVDFLYKIEQEKTKVLRIKQIQIKPRYDNKKLMDSNFQISTYRLSAEGG